jgi:phospholipid/cholesterol/gamma-HCH transport system ATP-binding protein
MQRQQSADWTTTATPQVPLTDEPALAAAGHHDGGVDEIEGVPPQIQATPGMPERKAVGRRQARVREIMHTLPPAAQEAIRDDLEGTHKYKAHSFADETPTASIPVQHEA